ncbi:MAG: hybrid sensor histidine kinase/response regulator [Myxococcales bacterium]
MSDKQETIMVVDDVPTNLKLLTDMLRVKGYHVLTFLRGAMALQAAAESPPDLILLDIAMPEMDGFEVCERLKANAALKEIPVIFISVTTEMTDKVKAFSVGGVDYVTKPFHVEEVNARVETHLRLRRQKRELKALNDTKDLFLGMAAHDLRNPLSGIVVVSGFLADEFSPLATERQKHFFDAIITASNFMLGLIDDLLDISAIESGHLSLNRQPMDITVPITRSIEINSLLASKKKMPITLSCPVDLPQVLADDHRIEQVVNNLLANAIKYCPPGTGIAVRLRSENNEIIVSIADQGPGIPQKEQHKLFRAFGKTSVQPVSREECSTGLGLLIVKKIVEAHEGKIGFVSEPGKGTEFVFSLPVKS